MVMPGVEECPNFPLDEIIRGFSACCCSAGFFKAFIARVAFRRVFLLRTIHIGAALP